MSRGAILLEPNVPPQVKGEVVKQALQGGAQEVEVHDAVQVAWEDDGAEGVVTHDARPHVDTEFMLVATDVRGVGVLVGPVVAVVGVESPLPGPFRPCSRRALGSEELRQPYPASIGSTAGGWEGRLDQAPAPGPALRGGGVAL